MVRWGDLSVNRAGHPAVRKECRPSASHPVREPIPGGRGCGRGAVRANVQPPQGPRLRAGGVYLGLAKSGL